MIWKRRRQIWYLGTSGGRVNGFARAGTLLILGAGGAANLTGSVAGNAGPGAAALAAIQPAINPAYRFNFCEIGTPVCTPPIAVTLTDPLIASVIGGLVVLRFVPTGLPPAMVLPDLVLLALPSLAAPPRQLTNPDVVPPNVSVLDY